MASDNKAAPRILIIDDMAINQMLLSSQLGALGVETDVCSSGEIGLERYAHDEYDLILLDQHMPDMDGYETLERFKEIFKEQSKKVPVICETADDTEEAAIRLKEAGFDEVLVKPIDFGELHDMMVRHLGQGYLEGSTDQNQSESDFESEYNKLPKWLHDIQGLDIEYGLKKCGGIASDYMDALSIFAASIDDKAKTVEHYLKADNEQIQILRIHSLKSSARLIGALTLAEQAAAMETAGKVGNTEALKSGTDNLIRHYRELEEQLKEHLGNGAGKGGVLPPISDETLHDNYTALNEAISSRSTEDVDSLLKSLGEYALSSGDAVLIERIRIARRKSDWDTMAGILSDVL